MEFLFPSLYMSNSDWFGQSTKWTKEENKEFERALALYDENEPDRWRKVAARIPGKSAYDVFKQYKELEEDVCDIEAGKVPIPGYSFTFNWDDDRDFDAFRKRPLAVKNSDHERKKGVPWTEEEHRQFLMGLLKYGKGDWRNISRNFVVSKTPTQVASHAQKYFIRQQLSGVKEKKRPSIHDITTFNLNGNGNGNGNGNKSALSIDHPNALLSHQKPTRISKDGSIMAFDSTRNDFSSNNLKFHGQNLYDEAYINPRNLVFQRHQIRG